MERKPLFITFEGGEGSGKSTQIKLFNKWFENNYGPARVTREPGGVTVSEKIREVLLNPDYKLEDLTELLLFESARKEFVSNVVAPTVQSGQSVISDRFYDSTTAYQGYARGLELDLINQLNNLVVNHKGNLYHPDLTFLIDIKPEDGLVNARARGSLNRLDSEALEFHQKVRYGFLDIAKKEPKRVVVVPYQDGIENVQKNIVNEFCERYK